MRVCLLQKFVAALAVENLVIIAHDLEVFGPGRVRVGLLLGLGYELVDVQVKFEGASFD